MAVIVVEGVTKEFRLGAMQGLVAMAGSLLGKRSGKVPAFKALDDVSFSVEAGEVVGVVGHNGAGKSTLLKLLSNISRPTRGRITVKGRIAPLIEVGAGLVGEMTGRENVYLNGAILGISRMELARKFDEIVAFAEIERFIDTPIKRLSSGMQVRLGFAIATSVDSDILIVDEVLAVGDVAFQRKCLDRMESIIRHQNRTVFVVSHQVRQLERFCTRVLLLERGRLVMDGLPTPVCTEFFARSNKSIKAQVSVQTPNRLESDELRVSEIGFAGPGALDESTVRFGSHCQLKFMIEAKKYLKHVHFAVIFHTTDFVYLTCHNNVGIEVDFEVGKHQITLDLPNMQLYPGVYQVRLYIGDDIGRESFSGDGLFVFDVITDHYLTARQTGIAIFDMPGTVRMPTCTPSTPLSGSRAELSRSASLVAGSGGSI